MTDKLSLDVSVEPAQSCSNFHRRHYPLKDIFIRECGSHIGLVVEILSLSHISVSDLWNFLRYSECIINTHTHKGQQTHRAYVCLIYETTAKGSITILYNWLIKMCRPILKRALLCRSNGEECMCKMARALRHLWLVNTEKSAYYRWWIGHYICIQLEVWDSSEKGWKSSPYEEFQTKR